MTKLSVPGVVESTDWEIKPSLKYDVLCFLNILTGDEFYTEQYPEEYEKFKSKITPEAASSLKNLKKTIKDDNGSIVSAWLCLYFSAVEDETIDQMITTIDNNNILKENFEVSPYHSDDSWKIFESIGPDLKVVLNFLKDIEFEKYWKENISPKVDARINEFNSEVGKYNVIGLVEEHLGQKLASNKITVYMLYYSRPHGIKITGTRFLTDIAWPFEILIRTASHEMMHPPFDLKNDTTLVETLETLKSDKFFMEKVENHNPSFGYNSFEGFVEEDCVQALDQIINEKIGVSKEPRKRWQESDDGMHVLAIALYNIMKEENYNSQNEVFRDFLIRTINSGNLSNGNIERIYMEFYK